VSHWAGWPADKEIDEEAQREYIEDVVRKEVVEHAIPARWLDDSTQLIVNGTGSFPDPGGPYSDAGITGRKIVVDAYGGAARHGGGAFSGKDPSKVDRSAAYGARWAAKHVVVAGLADRCEIQVAYVIGQAEPVSLRVDTFGTGVMGDSEISHRVMNAFDWRPAAIIKDLDLKLPIYLKTATGGHFGRPPTAEGHFPWERIHEDRIEALRSLHVDED
jgi:S-adenosylmethionine synthetase